MGRALLCAPFLSSAVLATQVLLAADDPAACADYLPELCGGARIATVAATDENGRWDGEAPGCTASTSGKEFTLEGRRRFVPDAASADLILVCALSADGPGIFAVDPRQGGVTTGSLETLDATRRLGWVELQGAPGRIVGTAGAGATILRRALVPTYAALAAEQSGGARRVLEMAVEYAKVREQFGRVIGSFQAIKQKCADVLLAVETATSTARAAALAIDQGAEDRAALAHLAAAHCGEAFVLAATESVEVHGGIGFTWEHSAHLYYKRAVASAVQFGTASVHRERLLAELAL